MYRTVAMRHGFNRMRHGKVAVWAIYTSGRNSHFLKVSKYITYRFHRFADRPALSESR